jgi:Glycosyltransferase like family 2
MAGLANLFPRSKKFAHYYQGHLAEWENSKVEVLSGAFMLINKEVWDITGGFDEDYFMYGEDIDLSYRILQAGFYNYYFPGTTIVHFKGESSREKDARYIRMFYQAMNIFVHKHMKRSVSSAFIAGSVWCMSFIALAVTKITRIQRQSARLKETTGKNFLLVGKNILTDEWHKKLEAAFKTNQINVLASEPTILSNKWKGQIDQPFSDIIFFIGEMTFINVISYMETRDGSVNYLFLLPFDKYLVGHHIVVRLPDEVLSQNPVKQTDI